MTFAQPWFLLGFGLFVPVILLYLLKQRRRRVEVSTLMFWDQILRDEQTVTSLTRLRKLLSLLLQLIFIALLTLAAARPSFSGGLTGRRIVLLVDCSASMLVQEGSRTRFDLARQKASDVVRGMSLGDTLMVVAVAAEADVVHPFTDNKRDLIEVLEKLEPTHSATDFARAMRLVEDLPATDRETSVYLISDGAFDAVEVTPPAKTQFAYLRIGSRVENVGITGFSVRPLPSSPRDFQVHIEITNDGDKEQRVPMELRIAGRLADAFEFKLPPGQAVTRTLRQFSAAGGQVEAVIDVPDAFALDNRAYAFLPPPQPIKVALVTPENLFLQNALMTDDDVQLEVIKPEKFNGTEKHPVTIFSGWHPSKTPSGNVIFIGSWPDDFGLARRGEVAKPLFTEWQRDHPVNRHLALQNVAIEKAIGVDAPAGFQKLASSFADPLVLLREGPAQKAVVLTFDTSTTDLPLRIAFPIMVANAIRYLNGSDTTERWKNPAIGTLLSASDLLRYANDVTASALGRGDGTNDVANPLGHVRAVIDPDGRRFEIRGAHVLVPVMRAGFYLAESSSGETNVLFASNLTNARESRVKSSEGLPLRAKTAIPEIRQGFRLGFEPWILLALFAAALSVVEWVLYHRRMIE